MTNAESYFTHNPETGKIELHFDRSFYMALTDAQKAEIKSAFYWFRASCCWVSRSKAPNLDQAIKCAEALKIKKADGTTTAAAAPVSKPAAVENADGVHVGDLFYCSWGWEQTNIDYYQVVALKGKRTAIIREICTEYIGGYGLVGECSPVPNKFRDEKTYTVRTQNDGRRPYIHTNAILGCSSYLRPTTAEARHTYTTYA